MENLSFKEENELKSKLLNDLSVRRDEFMNEINKLNSLIREINFLLKLLNN